MHTGWRLLLVSFLLLVTAAATPRPIAPSPTPLQQLYMLKEMMPDVKRVGVIWNQKSANKEALMPKVQRAAAATGMEVFVSYVTEVREVAAQFRDLMRSYRIQVLWVVENDGIVDDNLARSFLIEQATRNSIPILAPSVDWVESGACLTLRDGANGVEIVVNQSVAAAVALSVPEQYREQTQFLTAN